MASKPNPKIPRLALGSQVPSRFARDDIGFWAMVARLKSCPDT
ncbi:MAG TPA: hypothetical protein VMT05_09005 [Terriglobales bacterium]|nr:hypothetical protein [Terriglobales bacterium]